ncbi:pilus assembly protein [Actinocorallia sp. API 0066]|uniref:TadE/TadG family type IV pilus assembly protein n=1 Tax=Actinocorallia sp. API 0066 TaxID=2896846 RepID=UPI001E60DDB3|nr:TadE/TadG family type IV pilus assembly protein [Actinocorallia sp. API 0066]MCD0453069.1 pilus assembly protein [Actinocorallia sp. API 0066]
MEWALLTPILILAILFAIQAMMVYHANQIALSAAQAGARAAREMGAGGGWQGVGIAAAQNAAAQLGPNALNVTGVTALGDGAYDRGVQVTGTAVQIIPGMTFNVTKQSVGAVECFRPDIDDAKNCEAG